MPEGIWAWTLVLVLHCCSVLSQQFILAECNEDIHLPCRVSEQGGTYRYMVWYRNDTAIIKRKLNDVTFYNKSSPAFLGVRDTLVLQNVQPSDSGHYQCFLATDTGQKDRHSDVSLTVSGVMSPTIGHRNLESDCDLPQHCKRIAVEMTEIPSLLGGTHEVLSDHLQCVFIATVVVLAVLSVTAVVCLCTQRKTYTSVNVPGSV
ncbi:hypothetical protein Q7C36_012807 [Tachysurus vachellii]|uniref:Ig-like domain-containing protein n=1 Tax=Tachysurus vachellii TaxID=175792 RepID=A0AA88MN58_TACVA|nr:hypothetical protein Q7C36_012807 [Tachysurus vachellii]